MDELTLLIILSAVSFLYDAYQLFLIRVGSLELASNIKYEVYLGLLRVLYSAGLSIPYVMDILARADPDTTSEIFRYFRSKLLKGQSEDILSIFADINIPYSTALESIKTTLSTIEKNITSRLYRIEEFEEESIILIFMLLFVPLISIEIAIILGNILTLILIPILHIIATTIIKHRLKTP